MDASPHMKAGGMAKASITPRPRANGTVGYLVRKDTGKVDPVTGKRIYAPGGGTFNTPEEAERCAARLDFENETDVGKLAALGGVKTLAEWSEEFLTIHSQYVKPPTIQGYRARLRMWVLPKLGHYPLNKLDSLLIQRWLDNLKRKDNGLPLSREAKGLALGVLKHCLTVAVSQHQITSSPAAGIKIKALSEARQNEVNEAKRAKAWSYRDARTLLEASVGLPVEVLIVLGLFAGLRPGEVAALLWSDLILEGARPEVRVRETRSEAVGKEYVGSPKTGLLRCVPLDRDAVVRLQHHRDGLIAAGTFREGDYVYGTRYNNRRNRLVDLCEKTGVEYLNPHCLRHTFASVHLAKGTPVAAIANALGHKNLKEFWSTYSHLIPGDQSLILGVMGPALGLGEAPEGAVAAA